jgi:hypothetical protein
LKVKNIRDLAMHPAARLSSMPGLAAGGDSAPPQPTAEPRFAGIIGGPDEQL